MILIRINRGEKPTEVMNSDSYIQLLDKAKSMVEEIEATGVNLVNFDAVYNKQIDVEFASTENGFECGLYLSSGWIKNVGIITKTK